MKATFRSVKADILSRITRGEWAPGALIPNETELAAAYGCARATVNRAMRELSEDGVIERRRKSGTRVRTAPLRQARFDIPVVRREIEARGGVYRYALVGREVCAAPDWLRGRLKLTAAGRVVHLTCMHYESGAPHQFENRWINLAALPEAEIQDFTETGPNEWLVATVPFSTVEISFSAASADEAQAQHLDCAVGDALFVTERSTWFEGRAITFVRLSHAPGYRMTTEY